MFSGGFVSFTGSCGVGEAGPAGSVGVEGVDVAKERIGSGFVVCRPAQLLAERGVGLAQRSRHTPQQRQSAQSSTTHYKA